MIYKSLNYKDPNNMILKKYFKGNLKELNGSNICTVTEFIAPDMYITIASEKTEAIVLKNINDWDLTRLFY